MVRLLALTILVTASTALACGGHNDHGGRTVSAMSANPQARREELRIRLTFNGKEAIVKLRESPTSRDLLGQLPLTLKLSDYAGTEKVATLPKKLSTKGSPSGFDPSVGDLTYYAPWGNLAIFYKDFGYAKGLIPLGVVESGLQELAALSGEVTLVVERTGR